jgi:hypothetical protein
LLLASAIFGIHGKNPLQAQVSALRSSLIALREQTATDRSDLGQTIASLRTTNDGLVQQVEIAHQETAAAQKQLVEIKAHRPLPTFAGQSEQQVTTLAASLGWQVGVVLRESSEKSGTVLAQKPLPGTMMKFGSSVTLVIAKPLPPKMPDLTGMKLGSAKALAKKFGWTLTFTQQASGSSVGTIISQTPSAGTFMRGAARFSVVVAKPSPPAPSPPPPSGGAGCDPNYSGACLNPNASDYDCAGGSGNGPFYVTGPFRVIGYDHFGLDSNGNGIACE